MSDDLDDIPTHPMYYMDNLSEAAKLEMAQRLIAAIYPTSLKIGEERTLPDPGALAKAVCDVYGNYFVRQLFDLMPGIDKFTNAYADLKSQAKRLQASIAFILQTPHVCYELLGSIAIRNSDLDLEDVFNRFSLLNEIAGEFAEHATNVQSELEAMKRRAPNQGRLYELEEGSAQHWLYGHAIPTLFRTHFGVRYSIRGDARTSSKGSRFAVAFLAETGLPGTSLANLRKQAQRAKDREASRKAAGQKD